MQAAKNVAMQAAAMNPIALNEDGVDAAQKETQCMYFAFSGFLE